jgi:hypothetical protein
MADLKLSIPFAVQSSGFNVQCFLPDLQPNLELGTLNLNGWGAAHSRSILNRLDFEKLRAVSKISVALFSHEDDVFEAYAADAEVVQAWFDGDNVPFSEYRFNRRDPGRLVYV